MTKLLYLGFSTYMNNGLPCPVTGTLIWSKKCLHFALPLNHRLNLQHYQAEQDKAQQISESVDIDLF